MPRRSHDPEPRKWDCYTLDPDRDDQLTEWMSRGCGSPVWPKSSDVELAAIEGRVMQEWQPPLNLIGVETPWRRDVKAARADMVQAAKQWARDCGFEA
jgi:hypothetical protein